jgi:hypothetical protein
MLFHSKKLHYYFRTIRVNDTAKNQNILFKQTTCGWDSFRRGATQKIVGFSFYGDMKSKLSIEKGYFEGLIENLKLMTSQYPGWIMRLYFDVDKNDPLMNALCNLACSDNNLDICDTANLPGIPLKNATKIFPMNWRHFPTLYPPVNINLS